MNFKRRISSLLVGLVMAVGLALGGCASSETEGASCSADHDCEFGERCNLELGVCEDSLRNDNNGAGNNGGQTNNGQTNNGQTNNGTPDAGNNGTPDADNNGTPDADNNGTPDADNNGTPDADEDTGDPNVCDPACGAGQVCDNGVCVDDPQNTCTQKGQACDPDYSDQGTFWCAPDGDGGGECLPKCNEPYKAEGCGVGEYCWELGNETNPAPACIESDCNLDSDCQSGTCLNFDNQFGLCLPSGSTPEGSTCDLNATNSCQPGLICREEPSNSGNGVCRSLCDPWTYSSGCPYGQMCNLFSSREGVCTPNTDSTGYQTYGSCSSPGSMCDDGVICLQASSSNVCIAYCRTGHGDCSSLPGPSTCNNYMVAGQRAWGLCLPRCPDQACGTGSVCQNGICRTTCTAGNEVQDCCNGNTPCDWSCVNGMCE